MSNAPSQQKMKLDCVIDKDVYGEFMKKCREKGYSPQVIVEKLLKRFIDTGQV
jgi:hypothetical protein